MNQTALWIIQQASGELGLPVPQFVTSIPTETGQQMLALLNSAGNDLLSNAQWEELTKEYNFTTVLNQGAYPLPSDYNFFIDSTGWDNTNRWPLLGPVSVQEWNALIAAKVTAVSRTYYKIQQSQVHIWPVPSLPNGQNGNPPTDGRNLVLSYGSLNWVTDSNNVPKANIDQDSDICILNSWLLVKLLKLKMWGAKGFDTTALREEFNIAFASFQAKSKGSRVLSLAPKTGSVFIGVQNVPEGNWIR
jgi:hypothetical protein